MVRNIFWGSYYHLQQSDNKNMSLKNENLSFYVMVMHFYAEIMLMVDKSWYPDHVAVND